MSTDSFGVRLETLLSFNHLEKPIHDHLKKVYSALSISTLVAAVGAYAHLLGYIQAGFLSSIGSLVLMVLLMTSSHSKQAEGKRFAYLAGFAFCSGLGLGPLINAAININPTILPTALMLTSAIFICFSLSALLSNDRKFIYLGGMLSSGLSILLFMSLFRIFTGSAFMVDVELYLGLVVMCGFILYDTQLIVEKRRMGNDDYIWHSVELFIDMINVFRYILVILARKDEDKKRRR
jgi:FtsH-binding integral membrane protein